MRSTDSPAPMSRRIVQWWFALDAVVALAPPLYWSADGATAPIAGIPGALAYFLAVSGCISLSVMFAWLVDRNEGAAA